VAITPQRYRLTVIGSTIAAFVVLLALTSTLPIAVLGAGFVAGTPRAFYRHRRRRELAERVAAWPEAIRDVLSALTSMTLHDALKRLGQTGPEPLRATWQRYAKNSAVLDRSEALGIARADLADPVSDRVIEVLDIALAQGDKIYVEVLNSLADNVTADLELHDEVVSNQADIRAQAIIVIIIPFVLLVYLVTRNSEFADFYSTPVGWVVISVGAVMAFVGWKVMNALGNVPDEPRVLLPRTSTEVSS
jgi:tight adherence protein B